MKRMKQILSAVTAFALVFGFCQNASAYEKSYNNDIVEPHFVTDVENQGETGDCLCYALTASAESFVLKYFGIRTNFNENSLKTALDTGEFGEAVDRLSGIELDNTFAPDGSSYTFDSAEELLPSDNDFDKKIKKAVKEYGAVTAVFNVCEEGMKCPEHYSGKEYSYYCPAGECCENTHAVSIVGWDDDRQAWLCKNSYGYDYGYAGFFWLSYSQVINGAVYAAVSHGEEKPDIKEELNWDDSYITSVYIQTVSKETMRAYGVSDGGEIFECGISLPYENNYYEVSPPDNAFFDGKTLCYFNGDKLERGFDSGNDLKFEFDEKTGNIGVQCKEPGAYSVKRIETPKYGSGTGRELCPGYVKLTYDNGAVRWIFKNDFNKNGIEFKGSFESADELREELPVFEGIELDELKEEGQRYAVMSFGRDFVLSHEVSDGRASVKDGENTLVVIIMQNLIPQINLSGMIEVATSWFGMIIGLIEKLVLNVSKD